MTGNINDLLVIITVMFWAVIPLFWIPVHLFSLYIRKPGLGSYLLTLFIWLPLALLIYKNKGLFLQYAIASPVALSIIGWGFLFSGTLLHMWTARLLGLGAIIGIPEVYRKMHSRLITGGPFKMVRHPTYLAHTLIFSGVFLITGAVSVGIVAVADFFLVNAVIIPLEEKELSNRFGEEYKVYKTKVSSRLFPRVY